MKRHDPMGAVTRAAAFLVLFASPVPMVLAAPAEDAERQRCEATDLRYEGIEPPPLASSVCNLPERPARSPRADDPALSRLRGEQLIVVLGRDGIPADGQSAVTVRVLARDRGGVPLARAVPVTVETSLGRIANEDTAFTRKRPRFLEDRDRRSPGVQSVLENGAVELTLVAPYEPGDALLRVSSGDVEVEARVSFLPDLRPALAVGILEGQVNVSKLSSDAGTPSIRDDGLEASLSTIESDSDTSADGRSSSLNGRAAFFYKGVLASDYLLTAAYDSDKERIRLFRDIQPDQFYPIYGDASLLGFDAQSTRRGYLRLDHGKSSFLFGDFTTGDRAGELRDLGLYSRSLTGARGHLETDRFALSAWGARDSVRQVIDEQPGRGISGPYVVSSSDGLTNSEKVEIVVRDRAQPSIVLSVQTLVRFADYELEPLTGRLLFRKPIPSLDENLNPVSIRVTYEVDEGGPEFDVFGADGRVRLGKAFELGASFARADDPTEPYGLGSVSASWQLGEGTVWVAEGARSDRDASFVQSESEGDAFRTELRHLGERFDARLFWGRSTSDFDNAAASLDGGRREAGGKLTWRVTAATDLTAEALRSEDARVGADRSGATVMLGHRFNDIFRLEGGFRWFDDEVSTAGPSGPRTTYDSVYNLLPPGSIGGAGAFVNGAQPSAGENTTARLRLAADVNAKSTLYAEGEQGIDDSDAYALGVGADYQVLDKGRLYARHEYAKSLSALYGLNENEARRATVIGLDSAYMKDGSAFSEYRLRSAIPGRESEAAVGLRNLWPVKPGLAFSTALERVQVFDGQGGDATAIALGVEQTRSELAKGSARIEWRTDDAADSWLSTLAYTRKLSRDWSVLGRDIYLRRENDDAQLGSEERNRAIIGFAYRETDRNLWNALLRYELKLERSDGLADPFDRDVHVVAAHANYHPTRPLTIAAQLAAKWVSESFDTGAAVLDTSFAAQLAGARVIYDLTERWDAGVQASGLFSDGSRQYGFGFETGYALIDNLWLSIGYNLIGFTDEDLVDSDYTRRGVYLRLRFKFDEKLFGGRNRRWNNSLTPDGPTRAASDTQ